MQSNERRMVHFGTRRLPGSKLGQVRGVSGQPVFRQAGCKQQTLHTLKRSAQIFKKVSSFLGCEAVI